METLKCVPLRREEYTALRSVFGTFNAYHATIDEISKRIDSIPGCREIVDRITRDIETLLDMLLSTVPADKLRNIQKELKHTKVEVNVSYDVTGKISESFCYVPEKELEELIDTQIAWQCLCCEIEDSKYKNANGINCLRLYICGR